MSAGGIDPKVIESIPPAVLRSTPAGQAPPGIRPNFVDPSTLVPAILGVGATFLALAILCFSLRIHTKLFITRKWQWDDLTCSLGFFCGIVYFVSVVNGCVNGATGRHTWDLTLDKPLNKASLYQDYITTVMSTPAFGLIKSSLFIQYYILFRPLRWVKISVWIGATISTTFYVAVSIAAFVLNSPWPGETWLEAILSWHYLKFSQFSIPIGVIGMLVDWYLLILPIPAVVGLQMSTKKKLGVLLVFMVGGLAAISSVTGLYYRVRLQHNLDDASWHVSYAILWGLIEMFGGVTASSMPTVHQFFARAKVPFPCWALSFKTSLNHLLSKSQRSKISDSDPYSTVWARTDARRDDSKDFELPDLESGHEVKEALPQGDSQIHLTHDIATTYERWDKTSSKPAFTSQY